MAAVPIVNNMTPNAPVQTVSLDDIVYARLERLNSERSRRNRIRLAYLVSPTGKMYRPIIFGSLSSNSCMPCHGIENAMIEDPFLNICNLNARFDPFDIAPEPKKKDENEANSKKNCVKDDLLFDEEDEIENCEIGVVQSHLVSLANCTDDEIIEILDGLEAKFRLLGLFFLRIDNSIQWRQSLSLSKVFNALSIYPQLRNNFLVRPSGYILFYLRNALPGERFQIVLPSRIEKTPTGRKVYHSWNPFILRIEEYENMYHAMNRLKDFTRTKYYRIRDVSFKEDFFNRGTITKNGDIIMIGPHESPKENAGNFWKIFHIEKTLNRVVGIYTILFILIILDIGMIIKRLLV